MEADEANSEKIREQAGPIAMQIDSFTPAHSARLRRACPSTLHRFPA
jgi:hypothetical protein